MIVFIVVIVGLIIGALAMALRLCPFCGRRKELGFATCPYCGRES